MRGKEPRSTTESRVMNRQAIEMHVCWAFTSPGPARDAALSEVGVFFAYPEALNALRLEVGLEIPPSLAVLRRALERGKQWTWAARRIPTRTEYVPATLSSRAGREVTSATESRQERGAIAVFGR